MTRRILTCAAGLLLAIGLSGCGGGSDPIPEGHSADEVRTPTGATREAPTANMPDAEEQPNR
ncbi:MAG: hypothetical protein O7G85_12620 [Planctomycetota bacterium]|nr:hypothetical protein [Planctomycetota bacterium]